MLGLLVMMDSGHGDDRSGVDFAVDGSVAGNQNDWQDNRKNRVVIKASNSFALGVTGKKDGRHFC